MKVLREVYEGIRQTPPIVIAGILSVWVMMGLLAFGGHNYLERTHKHVPFEEFAKNPPAQK